MQTFIAWVCGIIGVHSQTAIDVATGVVVGGIILGVLFFIVALLLAIINTALASSGY
jgi:hypothetical protein